MCIRIAKLNAPFVLQNSSKALMFACSHSRLLGRAPVSPFKAATGRWTSFGQTNQRKRPAPITRRLLTTRNIISNTDLEPPGETGGSAWLGSSAVLALGGALPGLLLAWKWQQVQAPHSSTAAAAVASVVLLR